MSAVVEEPLKRSLRGAIRSDIPLIAVAMIMALAGLVMRLHWFGGFNKTGFDEHIYETYVNQLSDGASYRSLVTSYLQTQSNTATAFLPPTRVSFLSAATLLKKATHISALAALHITSLASGILLVLGAAIFAARAAGLRAGCGALALMSAAPLEIHLSHRALIDGFFACSALITLWTLWETLRRPRSRAWLIAYALSLTLLVMTKENAAFVFLAVIGIIVLNHWLHFGTAPPGLLVATFAGPAVAVLALLVLSGGAETLFRAYLLNIQKSYLLDYAMKTGDGPWYRYLIDLFTISPVTTLLACGGLLHLRRNRRWETFLAVFLLATYVVMANLRYGMNLRYGAIWDLPIRVLAFAQLTVFASRLRAGWQRWGLASLLLIVCLVDTRQYFVFFVRAGIYDPVPAQLLRAVDILK